MTKLFYSPGTLADRDDDVHRAAVAAGQVGERCLLGGPALEQYMAKSPKDICAVCPILAVDRVHCGGRPPKAETAGKKTVEGGGQTLDVNAAVSYNQDQTAAAYRARQERFTQHMTQQILAQEAIRKKAIP